jgi:hypothetical protein
VFQDELRDTARARGSAPGAPGHLRVRIRDFDWDPIGIAKLANGPTFGSHPTETIYASMWLGHVRRQVITNYGEGPRP